MPMNNTVIMTKVGKEEIEKELEHLIKVEREEVKTALAEARANGDLSENADYSAAKERQSHVEGRIMILQDQVARSQVVDVSKVSSKTIVFGATVTLFDEEKDHSVTYQIVGDEEADINKGKISYTSPLGQALIGKEEGDEVLVKAPKGDVTYEVESFEYK